MPTPTQSAIRCLHRRAVFAAGSLLLPVLAELLVVFRSAFPSAALSSQRVLVIRSAFEVHRVLLAGGHAGRWGTGLALSPGLLLVGLSPALAAVYLHWHPAPGPASAAVQAARAIQGCAQRFAADHGGRFPA